jgi:glycosyltransferase involved in cell wall biosynthesis
VGVDAHLLLVGSAMFVARSTRFDNNDYVKRLQALVERDGLEERVSWLGERDDVPEIIRALDVLLLPSWEEPFGRAVLEAMAMGVPVVATDVGGPCEIVRDGREGYLREPRNAPAWAQAVRLLSDSPALAREMGRAGRQRAERSFTLAQHATAVLEVYERAIAARGRRAT